MLRLQFAAERLPSNANTCESSASGRTFSGVKFPNTPKCSNSKQEQIRYQNFSQCTRKTSSNLLATPIYLTARTEKSHNKRESHPLSTTKFHQWFTMIISNFPHRFSALNQSQNSYATSDTKRRSAPCMLAITNSQKRALRNHKWHSNPLHGRV